MKKEEIIKGKEAIQKSSASIPAFQHHATRAERYNLGKKKREDCHRTSHSDWKAPSGRKDPIATLLESEKGRMEKLLPLRHGRMARSPFTFYRGSALSMAADLFATPSTGIKVQACGDAHLSNFGGFATPERNVIFSINDLDETLPAPWEWDVKRLSTSFVVACRNNGLNEQVTREVVLSCVRSYRENMAIFSEMKTMELWYFSLKAEMMIGKLKDPEFRQRAAKRLEKERSRSVAEDIFPGLAKSEGGKVFIKDQLPAIFHWEGHSPGEVSDLIRDAFALYRQTLPSAYSVLLDRFELRDAAIKVVGIGSVGTLCWVLLFTAGEGDPFFLQVKEARPSVLEPFAGKSIFPNHGQRVIHGYRLIQPFSDPFLGWTQGRFGRHFFFRQLKDIKISIRVETLGKAEMNSYAEWCGQALALSHARSGDSVLLSGYLGKSDTFDKAIAAFSFAYADQNEKDHEVLRQAIRKGKIAAEFEE